MEAENKVCVKCNTGSIDADKLNQVGSKYRQGRDEKHPIDTIIEHAEKLQLTDLAEKLKENKLNDTPTYIHLSCRTSLKNSSRKRSSTDTDDNLSKRPARRSYVQGFDFLEQCFYCEKPCVVDKKHPSRTVFKKVGTKDTKIYSNTLEICKKRDDLYSKNIERRLLNVSDLFAVEARYHSSCRSSFENPAPKFPSRGRPASQEKLELFESTCVKLENEMDLYTLQEFHELMRKEASDCYSIKMTKLKLKEKYADSIEFASRNGKSDIILLSNIRDTLTEKWYAERKTNLSDEADRIVKSAAKLIKNAIKNHDHSTQCYPTATDISDTSKYHVPDLLQTFINELINNSLKRISISQAIYAAASSSSIMPLQFGLAVTTDNQLSSKWLNVLLSRLGFASSYDEVSV